MKVLRSKIVHIFILAIFSLALSVPVTLKTIHALDGHEHQVCHDFSQHIHKKQLDCSICDFHFFIFDFSPQQYPDFLVVYGHDTGTTLYSFPKGSADILHFYLRGPPLFS